MKLKIMYSDKQLQEIRSIAKKCMTELGPLELADPSDLYPLVRIASNETNILRFTKSVVLTTQEFTISSNPELLPTIHLYGPENLGNNEIIKCHPVIRSPSGKGIEVLQNPKVSLNQRSNIDDIVRINEYYKEYLDYLQNVFKITHNILSTEETDLISLCYDSVLKRPNMTGSHNLLAVDESVSDVVLTSVCRNALRMMRYKTYKPDRFIPPNETRYLRKIINVLEFPSTIDHICLTLSTRYQHKFEVFDKYVKEEYNSVNEYKDLLIRMPNSPHIRKALDIEKEVENVKNRVYQIVEQSIAVLKKDKLVVSEGKKYIPNADSIMIKINGVFQEVEMPSIETIRKRRKDIIMFDLYLKNKRKEWKNN